MKILLLGATGRTGGHLLMQALERGHSVHALVRNPAALPVQHAQLTVVEGRPNDPIALARAAEGCHAVVSSLNLSRTSDWLWAPLRAPEHLLSETMQHLLHLDQNLHFQRVVICTAHGVHETKQDLPGWFRWLIDHSNLRYPYADHERQENLLQGSNMNWTVVRPVGLRNRGGKKSIVVSLRNQPRPSLTIPRAAVAGFMLDVMESGAYLHQTPTLSAR